MTKTLERDLGLYATITISIGAMIGSGIFVLPGLAFAKVGPGVVLAYLLAGLLVLPAALSKAEMATAMPDAGGTYLYIDRAMGPRMGTIAGVGAWFSLVFKSAFALVGLGAYLLLLVRIPPGYVKLVGLGLGVALIAINVVGVKQTGRLQAAIVSAVLLALVVFIGDGLFFVENARYHPFLTKGTGGLLTAAGFVFVSYAGVTKIASVAEEVEDPGRNIPIAMVGSVAVMMLVYTLTIFVVVGVTPAETLAGNLTPMATAAEQFAGGIGRTAIALVAVLALTSMANAGLLSSSRFPLAMSRDDLAPLALATIGERFRTPVTAIVVTGAILLALIAFVPVDDLAKLASAFKILLFVLVNAALIAFRESELDWYEPVFETPGYPWVQLVGIVGGVVLIALIGLLPLLGAVGLVLVGMLWYRLYGREKTAREGAALDAIRRRSDRYSIEGTRQRLATDGEDVLVVMDPVMETGHRAPLLRLASAVNRTRGGSVRVVLFEEVPDQVTLSDATRHTVKDEVFEEDVEAITRNMATDFVVDEIVGHDIETTVVNYARRHEIDVILGEWEPEFFHGEMLGRDVDFYIEQAPCDVAFLRERAHGLEAIDEVAVLATRGPYDPLEIVFGSAVAAATGADLRFVHPLDAEASPEQRDSLMTYHDALQETVPVEATYEVVEGDDRVDAICRSAADVDLAVIGTAAHHRLYDVVFGSEPDEIAERLETPVLLVHSRKTRRRTMLRRVLDRWVF